jgi:two-component system cell cycle response regulator
MPTNILTIDDSPTIRLILAKAFRPYDCTVHEACNGVEGLVIAIREKPDLILLDLTMPIMDGTATLSKLRAHPELRSTPVIMLTAESDHENVAHITKIGVHDYILKPFNENHLLERVARVITLEKKELVSAPVQ